MKSKSFIIVYVHAHLATWNTKCCHVRPLIIDCKWKVTSDYMRFEVLTVKMSMLVLWVVTPSGLAGRYQRFGEDTASIFVPPKFWYLLTTPQNGDSKFSETSVNIYQTTLCYYNPENSHLYTRRRENLRFHKILCVPCNTPNIN
jgi:hypothetical protein